MQQEKYREIDMVENFFKRVPENLSQVREMWDRECLQTQTEKKKTIM